MAEGEKGREGELVELEYSRISLARHRELLAEYNFIKRTCSANLTGDIYS
jgi:hypothetical protein